MQRELTKAWWWRPRTSATAATWLTDATGLVSLNRVSDERLAAFGLNRTNAGRSQLLTSRIDSPLAASRGFKLPYAGFPVRQTVAQSLRPFPQFSSSLTPMWAPLGNSWYDSLQMKGTKRYSHGLDFTAAFTWQKELATGQGVNDVFNRPNQKSLVSTSQPLLLSIGFNYEFRKMTDTSRSQRGCGGWTVGGVLRYSSGMPIPVPGSMSNLNTWCFRAPE